MNDSFSKLGENIRETFSGSSDKQSTQTQQQDGNVCMSPGGSRILGQDLTHPSDRRDGTHTPLAWKEAKRAADSKIITEM